ncbi:hypothetical protein FS837_002239 [Tulasnella sp. UAMH 9824]|nr:hypothetical protein FS837_002239 [Tulasnella sp. UAMH 9824]
MAGGKRTSKKPSTPPKGSQEVAFSSPLAATTRALAIPEILISILSMCRKADLGRAALVSHKWSLVALEQLWKELDSIIPLLLLVQPLRLASDTGDETTWASALIRWSESLAYWIRLLQEFDGNVADTDWVRLRRYACRVRSLEFDENDTIYEEEESFIAPWSIQALALVHPFGPSLLPNLRKLSWCCTRDDTVLSILPFTSSSLSTLELEIEKDVSEEDIQRLLRSLTYRASTLEHFKLSTRCPVTSINESLAQCLNSKLNLRTVKLPQYFHTPEILASLGSLRGLEELGADWTYSQTDYIEAGTTLIFPQGSYPSLRTLHFHSSLTLATRLFRRPGPVSQLKEVCFSTPKCYPFKSLKIFLSALAQGCPRLETLLLNLASPIIQEDAPDGPLSR